MWGIFRILLFSLCASALISCNIYAPFSGNSSQDDYLYAAAKCLKNRDYDCAILNYSLMPSSDTKRQKLCLIYLAKAGISISTIMNTLNQGGQTMLGTFATQLLPWTQSKQDSLDTALTNCAAYTAQATSAKSGQLLNTVAVFSHCAIRIAKTDTYYSDNLDVCDQSRAGNGVVDNIDIADGAGGTITAKGMCNTDVLTCSADIGSLNAAQLSAAGLSALANALNSIPAGLTGGATTDLKRKGIQDCVP